jgi:hypothetical protein
MSRFYDPVSDFYSRPQIGHGISVFQGSRRQVGGGIFASIQRFAVPILRRIGQKLLSLAPHVGNKAMEVVNDTISDVRSGKRFGDSLKHNVGSKIRKTLEDEGLYPTDDQSGSGYRRQRRPKKHINKKRRKSKAVGINKRKKSSKKRASSKKFRDIFA